MDEKSENNINTDRVKREKHYEAKNAFIYNNDALRDEPDYDGAGTDTKRKSDNGI